MYTVVLLRHGESQWNVENRFTGWVDIGLSEKGIDEAQHAGVRLKALGYHFDGAYTSYLQRAIRTLHEVLGEMGLLWIPEEKSWRLNERHYGALQGLNKSDTAAQYGEEQVKIWRRSYDVLPPLVTPDSPMFPVHDPRYRDIDQQDLPSGESLKTTGERVIPYWKNVIFPNVQEGKKILIVAHGNSLRSLIQYFDDLTPEQVLELNIPTGKPLVYTLDAQGKGMASFYIE